MGSLRIRNTTNVHKKPDGLSAWVKCFLDIRKWHSARALIRRYVQTFSSQSAELTRPEGLHYIIYQLTPRQYKCYTRIFYNLGTSKLIHHKKKKKHKTAFISGLSLPFVLSLSLSLSSRRRVQKLLSCNASYNKNMFNCCWYCSGEGESNNWYCGQDVVALVASNDEYMKWGDWRRVAN